ncbi:MAG: hypothetical protein GY864_12870 [Desulfobacterales bacterium]|nr:hypothetical protein [Desulfobacterales bacterium]
MNFRKLLAQLSHSDIFFFQRSRPGKYYMRPATGAFTEISFSASRSTGHAKVLELQMVVRMCTFVTTKLHFFLLTIQAVLQRVLPFATAWT